MTSTYFQLIQLAVTPIAVCVALIGTYFGTKDTME